MPSDESYLALYGPQLLAQGYEIVPIRPGLKHPGKKNWQSLPSTESALDQWLSNGYAEGGVGIRTRHTPVIDIDVYDEELSRALVDYCQVQLGPAPLRVGKPPKTALVYRTDTPFRKVTSNTYVDWEDREHRVEILGEGQQMVAYALHPDTGAPYAWSGDGLAGLPANSLTPLSLDDARDVVRVFEEHAERRGWELKTPGNAGGALTDFESPGEAFLTHHKPPMGLSHERIAQALRELDPNRFDYDGWLQVGMGLYHETGGSSEGYQLWVDWSERSDKHHASTNETKWPSFAASLGQSQYTFRSVYQQAKAARKARKAMVPAGGFQTFGWSDLDDQAEPPVQLVEDLMVYGQSSLISAQPNTGKSAFILDLAVCVAAGHVWRDKRVEQGRALYVAAESPETIRARMLAQQRRDALSDLPLDVVQERVALTDEEQRDTFRAKLLAYIDAHPDTNLIILDTFRAATPGLEENASNELGAVVGFLHALAAELNVHIVIIHHTTKAGTTYAGSGAFGGIVDTEIMITEGEKELEGLIVATVKQQRGLNSRASEFWYEIEGAETGRITNFGTPETAPLVRHLTQADLDFRQVQMEAAQASDLHAVMEHDLALLIDAMREGHTTRTDLMGATGLPQRRLVSVREYGVETGAILSSGDGKNRRYQVAEGQLNGSN